MAEATEIKAPGPPPEEVGPRSEQKIAARAAEVIVRHEVPYVGTEPATEEVIRQPVSDPLRQGI